MNDPARTSNVQRLKEIRAWIEKKLDEVKNTLAHVACVSEDDTDMAAAYREPLEELPTMINDYDDDSPEMWVIKKRLSTRSDPWEGHWDDRAVELVQKSLHDEDGELLVESEEEPTILCCRSLIGSLQELAVILGDTSLKARIDAWYV